MIGHFPTACPDELLYSICARFGDRVQYTNKEAVNTELFGARGCAAAIDLPSHLDYLAANLPHTNKDSCRHFRDKVIDNNTLLPLYRPFLPPERVGRIRAAMASSRGSAIHNQAGITPSILNRPNWLRFCHTCVEDDKKQFEISYWHRLHQVPGVEVCPLHHLFLANSNVRARNRVNSSVYVSAESSVLNTAQHPLCTDNPDHKALLQVARDATWLLEQSNLDFDFSSLRDRYLMLLAENGLLLNGESVSLKRLLPALRNKYSHNVLEMLGCEYDEQKSSNWPSLLIPHLVHQKTDPPIRHLLFLQLLGSSAQEFFCRPVRSVLPASQSTRSIVVGKPFGDGPWPCLNPVCKQYEKFTIKVCDIKINQSSRETPVGTFACHCGFTYKRKGPDRSLKDHYRHDRVVFYGIVWESYVRKAWSDSSISVRQIALKLKVKWDTVKLIAINMNLRFPREGPARMVAYSRARSTRNPQAQKKLTYCFQATRSLYRDEWSSIREQHPHASRSQLNKKLAGRSFTWLHKHDKEWLLAHLPARWKRIGSARKVDWEKRDDRLAKEVVASAQRLRNAPGRPVRITQQAIGRELDEMTSLNSKKSLSNLPLTVKALRSVVEARIEYAIRRIKWAATQLQLEEVTGLSELRLRAAICHEIWYVPEVKAAFDEALQLLQTTGIENQIIEAA